MVGDSEEEEEGPPPGWEIVEAEAQPPTPVTPPTPTLPFSPTDIYMGIEQLEVQEEEGPPPGWHIIPPQSNMGNEKIDDEEEGPPPGWDSPPKSEQQTGHENNEIEKERQPPSWHFVPLPESEIGNGHQDIEGPPPGWPSMPPTQQNITIEKREIEVGTELGSHFVPSPQIRTSSELEAVYNKEIGIHYERRFIDPLQPIVEYKQEDIQEEDMQTGSNSIPLPQPQVTSPMVPPLQLPFSDTDTKSEQEVADEEGPPPGWHLVKPNKTNSEHQGIQEGASCGWASSAKPKKELEKHDFIEGAGEEGPPPGWHSLKQNKMNSEHLDVKKEASRGWTSAANPKTELEKQDIPEGAEEERPLPGWHSIEQNKINNEYQDIEEGASHGWTSSAKPITEFEKHNIIEEGADEEGPPPGWHLIEQNKINSEHQDIKEGAPRGCTSPEKLKGEIDKQDIIDEGPPPGWNLMPPPQRKAGSENQAIKSEGPPHGSHSCPPPQPKLVGIKQDIGEERPQHTSNSVCQQPKMGQGPQEVKEEGSQPGLKSMPPPPSQIRPPMPPMSTASKRPTQSGNQLEMGQMVCGFCRRLLSYARGAKYVQCSSCQTVNLVLEAHQVGQVKCGGCEVLLMYQFGAGAVQCASCRHVTDIGVQNRRPPLSAQQARGRRRQNFNR